MGDEWLSVDGRPFGIAAPRRSQSAAGSVSALTANRAIITVRRFPEIEVPINDSRHPRESGDPPFGPM
jgi:hypothetical protein